MGNLIAKHRSIWGDDPSSLLQSYTVYPGLTGKLDRLKGSTLNRETLYEIVLWKLGRFPEVEDSLIEDLKTVSKLEPKGHMKARDLISRLLRSPGIALPMASTILRFLNPGTFQIIDERAYRVLFPGKPKYPSKPVNASVEYVNTSIEMYFQYLDELHRISSKKLPFEMADRILYQLDILLGNKLDSTNLATHSTRTRRKRRAGQRGR